MGTPPLRTLLTAVAIFVGQSSGRPTYVAPIYARVSSFLPFLFEYTLVSVIKGNEGHYNSTMPMYFTGGGKLGRPSFVL